MDKTFQGNGHRKGPRQKNGEHLSSPQMKRPSHRDLEEKVTWKGEKLGKKVKGTKTGKKWIMVQNAAEVQEEN